MAAINNESCAFTTTDASYLLAEVFSLTRGIYVVAKQPDVRNGNKAALELRVDGVFN